MCLAGATKTGGLKREQSSNTTACTAYFEEVSVFPLGFSKFNFQCLCSNKCSLGNCIQPETL